MKTNTFSVIALSTAFILGAGLLRAADENKTVGEKTAEAWDKTKEVTKDAAAVVKEKTVQAVEAVEDAIEKPDADARKVNVTVSDKGISMPATLKPGKTAFIVKNTGKMKHNFEIKGAEMAKSFWLAISPGESKTMQVDLKAGTYKSHCRLHEGTEPVTTLAVK